MKEKVFFLILIIALLSGCSLSYQVRHQFLDRIGEPFTFDKVQFAAGSNAAYFIERTVSKRKTYYSIIIEEQVYSRSRLSGGQITMQIDDEIVKVYSGKPFRYKNINNKVNDIHSGVITSETLMRMSKAKILRIEVNSAPLTIDEKGISFIKRFQQEFG